MYAFGSPAEKISCAETALNKNLLAMNDTKMQIKQSTF